jgi:hypothetical protein
LINQQSNNFKFKETVWRIFPEPETGKLFAELRDGELRKVKIVCLEVKKPGVLWEVDVKSWWSGIVYVSGKWVILNNYKDPRMPEPVGFTVISAENGEVISNQPDLSFISADEKEIFAAQKSGASVKFFAYTPQSGILTETGEPGLATISYLNPADAFLKPPMVYLEDENYYQEVKEFLTEKGFDPVKNIEYLEVGGKIIISFYESQVMDNLLCIFGDEGELIYKESSGQSEHGIGLGTFFVIKEDLIFVRDKKEIVILGLNF